MTQGIERVRSVPSSVRGSCVDGVRMRRVLAASIGARTNAARVVATVDRRTVVMGELEDSIDGSGIAEEVSWSKTSGSATPNTAPKNDRKKVSSVPWSML